MEQHSDKQIPCEIRRFLRERQNIITDVSNPSELIGPLSDVVELFLRGSLQPAKVPLEKRAFLKAEFVNSHFVRFAECILSSPVIGFYSGFSEEQKRELFDVFFLRGPSHDSLLVLGEILSKKTTTHKSTKVVVSILEKFCIEGRLVDIFVQQCQVSRSSGSASLKFSQSEFESKLWRQLITIMVSLPQRVANKMRQKCSSLFYPEPYFKMVAEQILKALEKLHDNLSMSCDCSFKFLGEVIGRVCMAGQAETTFAILLPALEKWLQTSPLWNRICARLITGVPDHTMEHVAEGLLKSAKSPMLIAKLLGDSVLTSSKLKYLLTTKFLLMRCYSNINVLHNIIGYLSGCKRRHLLEETLLKLFDVWADKSAIKHATYDQHFYITCAVVLSFSHLSAEEKALQKHALLTKLLVGVQSHLDSPLEKVRRLGMVVAECVTSSLEPSGEKLKFDYAEDDDTKLLHLLAKGLREGMDMGRVKSGKSWKECNGNPEKDKETETNGISNPEHASSSQKSAPQNDGDVSDDDDELLPYDLDDEEERDSNSYSPKHLRDCIDGLIASDDPPKTEGSLKALQKLINAGLDDLEDVSVELVKLLLHLQDKYSTDKFCELRHNAMVSVTIRCPQQIACYLTEEFFAPNYNLQQRMDMLNVLADAAQQLSAPAEVTKMRAVPRKFPFPQAASAKTPEIIPEWQKIVQERINSKTKRFVKGPTKPQPLAVANKFAGVAGFFFFPLMKNFDSKVNTLDLLGGDTLVLGRLIYTLGIIMYSARETPIARNMGTALLEFTWALKYHQEPFVRQSLIFAQAMVAVSVPSSSLVNDAPGELFELHDWLKMIVQKDSDADSVKSALQTLVLLEDLFKNEVIVHG